MNPFKVLGIENENEAKQAYRDLSKKYHPDRPGGDTEKFQQVKEAYEMIKEGNATMNPYDTQKAEDIFKNYFGNGGHKKKKKYLTLNVKLSDILNEKTISVSINNKSIKIKLNRNLYNGSKIKADEYVFKIKVENEKGYKMIDKDIYYPLEINYLEAMAGVRKSIPSPVDDLKVHFKVPKNVGNGHVEDIDFKVPIKVKFIVKPPSKDVSQQVRELLEEL